MWLILLFKLFQFGALVALPTPHSFIELWLTFNTHALSHCFHQPTLKYIYFNNIHMSLYWYLYHSFSIPCSVQPSPFSLFVTAFSYSEKPILVYIAFTYIFHLILQINYFKIPKPYLFEANLPIRVQIFCVVLFVFSFTASSENIVFSNYIGQLLSFWYSTV